MKILFYCGIHNLVNFNRIRPYYDKCYGFDANPEKVENARNAYKNDPDVVIVHGALTEKGGEEVEFTITTNWDPASSLGSPNPEYALMKNGLLVSQKAIKVPTINLYQFCINNNILAIDTLITDLQGMDLTVLKTLKEMIELGNIREIQNEVEPDNTPPVYTGLPSNKFKDFERLLSDKYDVLWITPESLEQAEAAWEMDVRWRVKGGQPTDNIEFYLEKGFLVAKGWYGQFGDDLVIDALLSHKREGYYVDIGANDPDAMSNTKLFYNRGWRGINIEPEPSLHARLCMKRERDINLNVGIGPNPGVMTFYRMSADTLSSFNKQAAIQSGKLNGATLVSEEPTPILRLDDVLDSHLEGRVIDFMSVDAEGYDLEVLKSNDWSRYRPSLIIVEINVGGGEIIKFLKERDYILVFDNLTNGIFVSKEYCATMDNRLREEIARFEHRHNVRFTVPHSDRKHQLEINVVYGHLTQKDMFKIHRGNVSIVWSPFPLYGYDAYVYNNAFNYRGKRGGIDILMMLEPMVVLPGEFDEAVWKHFDSVLTLFDALAARGGKFKKIFFPHLEGISHAKLTEDLAERKVLYPIEGRRNAICMINGYKQSNVPGELYSRRVEVARWFHEHSDIPFDVYGSPPFPLPNFKGPCSNINKPAMLKQYRYCLCFENTDHPVFSSGYITEKIVDCLETRTIPIYLGASNIENYIPPECFIDCRKFKNISELDAYLHSITDQRYEHYISNIDIFVRSGGLRKFSVFSLCDALADVVVEENNLDKGGLFKGDDIWRLGSPPALQTRDLEGSKMPVMWTWQYLSEAESPLLHTPRKSTVKHSESENNVDREEKKGRLPRAKAVNILMAGMKYSHGMSRRGYDYWWWNLFEALRHFENVTPIFDDYALDAQKNGVAAMSERLLDTVKKTKPDILIYNPFDAQADVLRDTMTYITEHTDTATMAWMTNDHLRFDDYSKNWAPCLDFIITTTTSALKKYQQFGFGNKVIKSQWACNPYTYRPMNVPRSRDVSFVGMAHGNRSEVIKALKDSGVSVEAFGLGWPGGMDIPFQDMIRIFGESKISLNLSSSSTIATQQIRGRNFEVPGCRGFLLTTPAEDLEEYYIPDREVVVAASTEELIDKARYYLSHESERETIARRGYERTLAEHTWTHRFVEIFKAIGFNAIPKLLPAAENKKLSSWDESKSSSHTASKCDLSGESRSKLASIHISAHNNLDYTRLCVESILHYTKGDYELILVDNGSTDGTFEYFESVKRFHPLTRVVRFFRNRVVEDISNWVLSTASGEYLVGITNDVVVHEYWLEDLIDQLESAEDVGMVGPRSNLKSGPQLMKCSYRHMEEYHELAGGIRTRNKGRHFQVGHIDGMCTITKRKILERVGGWDPGLPTNGSDGGHGFSDYDMSFRLRLAGYRLLVADDVLLHHFNSITAGRHKTNLFGERQNSNRERFRNKVLANPRITTGTDGVIHLMPVGLNDEITVPRHMQIRFPQVCLAFVGEEGSTVRDTGGSGFGEYISSTEKVCRKHLHNYVHEKATDLEHDYLVVIDGRYDVPPADIRSLIESIFNFPDAAIIVPCGTCGPLSQAATPNTKSVECIPYADISVSVMNLRLLHDNVGGVSSFENPDEAFWFLQRRIRGSEYFIARNNGVVINSKIPQGTHPYDNKVLPETLMEARRFDEAKQMYLQDIAHAPTFIEALYQLALIAETENNRPEAFALLKRILEIDEHNIPAYIMLSQMFMASGNLKGAETAVKSAYFEGPGRPDVQKLVEEYESHLDKQEERAKSEQDQKINNTLASANSAAAEGRWADAAEVFRSLLTDYPELGIGHAGLGSVLMGKGDHAAAIQTLEKAVAFLPMEPSLRLQLSQLYRQEGTRDKAIAHILKAVEIDPLNPEVLVTFGNLGVEACNQEAFQAAFYKLQQVAPEHPILKEWQDALLKNDGEKVAQTEQAVNNEAVPSPVPENILKRPVVEGLTTIIVSLSSEHKHIKECLESIDAYTPDPHEIVIVNSGAKGHEVKWLKKQAKAHDNYILLQGDTVFEAAGLFNEGIKASSGEYVLLISDNVVVSDEWLSGMQECLKSVSGAGIVGPMTVNVDGPQCVADEGCKVATLGSYAADFRARNRHRRIPAASLSGVCLMLRREVIEAVGLFDEALSEAGSAIENYCIRVAMEGYLALIAGDVFVHNYGKESGMNKQPWKEKWPGIDGSTDAGKKLALFKALHRARELNQRDQIDKAIERIVEGIKYCPREKAIYYAMAEMLIDVKRFTDALEALGSLPDDVNEEPRSLVLFGYCKEGLELLEDAEKYADRALSLHPDYAPALNLKGMIASKRGEKAAAQAFFRKAITSDPGYGEPYTNIGVLKWQAGEKDEALNLFEKGYFLSPTVSDVLTLYQTVITEMGQYTRAERVMADVVAAYPHHKKLRFSFISVLLSQEMHTDAMREIERAMISFGIDEGLLAAALSVRDKVGPMEISKTSAERGTLSVCMIVKNEEEHIVQCLMSLKPISDEIIVVDTGSTDKTKDLARAFGAQVHEFPWTGDFSEARNYSLSRASGKWILVHDADEVISSLDYDNIGKLLKQKNAKPVAYTLTTRNYTTNAGLGGWTANRGEYPEEEAGTGWHPSPKVRLFTRDIRVLFQNLVHEVVEPSLLKAGFEIKPCNIPVHHYGKLNQEKTKVKAEVYYQMGKQKLSAADNNPAALRELAVQAGELGRYTEALDLFLRYIPFKPDDYMAYYNMATYYLELGQFEDSRGMAKKSMELAPDSKEALLGFAAASLCLGDIRVSISILVDLLGRVSEYPPAMAVLAAGYFVERDKGRGLDILGKLKMRGYNASIALQSLAKKLIAAGKVEHAIRLLQGMIESGHIHEDTRKLLEECEAKRGSES